jgi:formylglycine-generating enzyme required for sulfatase activity
MLTKADTGASERVSRGGYWYYPAGNCAVSYRSRITPANRYSNIGLRLAQVP